MVINYSTFSKKKLQRKIRQMEQDYDICYYNADSQDIVDEMAKYQRLLRIEEGTVIEKVINEPVLDYVIQNTKNSILYNYQFVACEDGYKTVFMINPVSMTCDRISDLPKNWFNKYIKQITKQKYTALKA